MLSAGAWEHNSIVFGRLLVSPASELIRQASRGLWTTTTAHLDQVTSSVSPRCNKRVGPAVVSSTVESDRDLIACRQPRFQYNQCTWSGHSTLRTRYCRSGAAAQRQPVCRRLSSSRHKQCNALGTAQGDLGHALFCVLNFFLVKLGVSCWAKLEAGHRHQP